jgi:hypothetical protein
VRCATEGNFRLIGQAPWIDQQDLHVCMCAHAMHAPQTRLSVINIIKDLSRGGSGSLPAAPFAWDARGSRNSCLQSAQQTVRACFWHGAQKNFRFSANRTPCLARGPFLAAVVARLAFRSATPTPEEIVQWYRTDSTYNPNVHNRLLDDWVTGMVDGTMAAP